ncbi:MAG: hypothetical protein QOJ99_2504 [Bryobacterales bacterium]|nr:hypothetical protein [Bryobacterales bacterium]
MIQVCFRKLTQAFVNRLRLERQPKACASWGHRMMLATATNVTFERTAFELHFGVWEDIRFEQDLEFRVPWHTISRLCTHIVHELSVEIAGPQVKERREPFSRAATPESTNILLFCFQGLMNYSLNRKRIVQHVGVRSRITTDRSVLIAIRTALRQGKVERTYKASHKRSEDLRPASSQSYLYCRASNRPLNPFRGPSENAFEPGCV